MNVFSRKRRKNKRRAQDKVGQLELITENIINPLSYLKLKTEIIKRVTYMIVLRAVYMIYNEIRLN